MDNFDLSLYVAGRTPSSRIAIATVRRVCEQHLPETRYEVVDILEEPRRAETDKILATPTLIRWKPEPVRRIVGCLDHPEEVLVGLDEKVPDVEEDGSS